MKSYLKSQLTEPTAWLGLFIILAGLFMPRWFIIGLGIAAIAINEDAIKAYLVSKAPFLSKKIDGV
jgi:hypothetical protein